MDDLNPCKGPRHRVYLRFPNQSVVRSVVTSDVLEAAEAFCDLIKREALYGTKAMAVWSKEQKQIAVFRFDFI
jgi:hypothetical protein